MPNPQTPTFEDALTSGVLEVARGAAAQNAADKEFLLRLIFGTPTLQDLLTLADIGVTVIEDRAF